MSASPFFPASSSPTNPRCILIVNRSNVEEAQAGQSLPDFTSKYNIALKEARETHYWLRLIKEVDVFPNGKLDSIVAECDEIIAILTTIVKKLRAKMG